MGSGNVTTLLTAKELSEKLRFRSRSGLHNLLARDRELQACAIRLGRRLLFDPARVERYLERRRLTRTTTAQSEPDPGDNGVPVQARQDVVSRL